MLIGFSAFPLINSTTRVTRHVLQTSIYTDSIAQNVMPIDTSANKQKNNRKCMETIKPIEQIACVNGKYEKS